MDLIKRLNERANQLTLHTSGSPRFVRRGKHHDTVVDGYIYDPNDDEETNVVIHYEYEQSDPGDHFTPGADAQVHIYKVVLDNGAEVPLDRVDTESAEIDLHDHHKHDHEDHRY